MTQQREFGFLYGLSYGEMQDLLIRHGFSRYAHDQVYNWLYKKLIYDRNLWSNTSKKLQTWIEDNVDTTLPEVIDLQQSQDGTRKFLLKLHDGLCVESVTIPMPGRLTLCVSTQVGCAMGCHFCRTSSLGFARNLFAGEIVGQFLVLSRWLKDNVDPTLNITNLVYMGQGEPLHNFDNVKKATMVFLEDKGISIGQRRVTLSTVGFVPRMRNLVDFPPVNIAISLHATSDQVRNQLMPINEKYNLEALFQAIADIPLKAQRRITYEYLLIDGLNDRLEDIEGLCRLLKKKESKVNLIPFNGFQGSSFKVPSTEKVLWFQKQLLDRDYVCTIRSSKGDDILAACGQLAGQIPSSSL